VTITLETIAKLSTTKKVGILALILFLLGGCYYQFSYKPKQDKVVELETRFSELRIDLAKKQAIAAKLEQFKMEVAKLNDDFERLLVQLPNKKEIPNLLSSISRLGKETGLEFLLFKPKPEVQQDFYSEIPVDIKVLGTYHNVASFFDEVSRLSRIVNITQVSMTMPKISDEEVLLTTSCLATTFKFIERKQKSETNKKK